MLTRTPYDGEPYYCTTCGLNFGEYMACEELCCQLESREDAQDRRAAQAALAEMNLPLTPKDNSNG